jgi:diguanylate cyclase (GGDEF)-like protein
MTIFQKMLLVPVLSLILYSGFIIYSYSEHQQSNQKIAELRDNYLPILEVANQNIQLFKETREVLKDAVLAGESAWLASNTERKRQINQNFIELSRHPTIVNQDQLLALQQNFDLYYINGQKLAAMIISNNEQSMEDHQLIDNVEQYHNQATSQFENLKTSISEHFRQTIDDTNQALNQLLFWSSAMAVSLMLFLITVTLFVSLHTRNNVRSVIARIKALAQGSTDFSQRLVRTQRDELGYLIYWFNKLSDKLEQDYIRIETISITDNLTKLNNRNRSDSFFPQALLNAQREQTPLCVVIIDIDLFKSINDTHGHLAGDEVLKTFADILRSTARFHDFVARWGGEEFILILSNTSLTEAASHVEKIRQAIEKHNFKGIGRVTASFGIALANHKDNVHSMMQRADECLYAAKKRGRNCVIIEQDIAKAG